MEVSFTGVRPSISEVQEQLLPLNLGGVIIQPTGDRNIIVRSRYLTEDEHQMVLSSLSTGLNVNTVATTTVAAPTLFEERFETVGASVSSQLRQRAWRALIAVIVAVILYIAYSFRKVSKPVASWKYGVTVVIALMHDVLIVAGVFALLGKYKGVEVDIPFAVALLTVMGYSMNNSIIVFDRVRENLIRRGTDKFEEMVNAGISESVVRTINSSLMTLLVLSGMYFFGGDSIHYFSLALIIGIVIGTYSAMFVSSPLLVVWEKRGSRN